MTARQMRNQVVGEVGTCYLVCLSERLGNEGNGGRNAAGHYGGWTAGDVEDRLETHRAGRGSRLLRAANQRGIDWELVRTWEGVDRYFERRLKNRGSMARICPNCNPDAMLNAAA